jgi:hypothetical protein
LYISKPINALIQIAGATPIAKAAFVWPHSLPIYASGRSNYPGGNALRKKTCAGATTTAGQSMKHTGATTISKWRDSSASRWRERYATRRASPMKHHSFSIFKKTGAAILCFYLAASAAQADAEESRIMIKSMAELSAAVGKEVEIEGRVSKIPWQHLVGDVPGKTPEYFDLQGGGQIIVYVPKDFSCRGRAKLFGKVIEIEGGGKGQKIEERFVEHHLDVSSWNCLGGKLEEMIFSLTEKKIDKEAKRKIEEEIIGYGKEAIPILIELVNDHTLCWKNRELINQGELMNRPINAPPVLEMWMDEPVTLGNRADWMLLRIITPPGYISPFASNMKPFSAGSNAYLFRVKDWKAWWEKNKGKGIEKIREEMKPVIDAYWKEHGVEQVVR